MSRRVHRSAAVITQDLGLYFKKFSVIPQESLTLVVENENRLIQYLAVCAVNAFFVMSVLGYSHEVRLEIPKFVSKFAICLTVT